MERPNMISFCRALAGAAWRVQAARVVPTRRPGSPAPGWSRGLVLGFVGFVLCAAELPGVPPPALNVTALSRWPVHATGRATDAQLVNEYLYVSLEEGGFLILNASDPKEPTVLWSIRFPGTGPVGILGRFVYVGGTQLHIIEVTDFTRPNYRGTWFSGGNGGNWDARALAIDGSHAYVVGSRGLLVLDLSNPAAPTAVGTNEFTVAPTVVPRVVIDDGHAYVVYGTQLRMINIRDPRRPTLAGIFADTSIWPGLHDVAVRGALAYLGNSTSLQIVDIANRSQPRLLLSHPVSGLFAPLRPRLLIKDDYLYVGAQGYLTAFDISDPVFPVASPRVSLGLADDFFVYTGDPGIRAMTLGTGGQLVLARGYDGVELMSLDTPAQPRPMGRSVTYTDVRAVKLSGNHAFILNFPAGIQVLDMTVPSQPALVRTEPYPHSRQRYQPFDSIGAHVYLLGPSGQLSWLNFSDLSRPPAHHFAPRAGQRISSLAVSEAHAIVTAYEYEGSRKAYLARVYNLSDVSLVDEYNSLDLGATLACHTLWSAPAWLTPGGVDWIKHQRVYHLEGELTVSHLLADSGLVQAPHLRTPVEGCFRLVSTTGHRDYVGGEGVVVLDTSQPDAPVVLGRLWTNGINGLSAERQHVVLTDQDGLKVLDALDPQRPRLLGYYQSGDMRDVTLAGRFALVARGQEGLLALDLGETLTTPPRVTRDIRSVRVAPGGSVRFDLGVVGSPPLRYQWQRNGRSIPGQTNSFLSIPVVTGPDSGAIVGAAVNAGGVAVSSVANVVINEEPGAVVEGLFPGDVFPTFTMLPIQVSAQDDRAVTRLVIRKNAEIVATLVIDPPEQNCQRVVEVPFHSAGTQHVSATVFDEDGASTVSPPLTVHITDQPTFLFATPHTVLNEVSGGVALLVKRVNADFTAASVHVETADLSARAVSDRGPGHYYALSQTIQFRPGEEFRDVRVLFVTNMVYQGDRSFVVRLSQPSAGWVVHPPGEARVTIQDDDSPDQAELWTETQAPRPAASARGSLQIRLEPPQALGKWRFRWETRWRDSGETAGGLVPGNYPTVFLPRSGYLAPEDAVLTIAPGGSEVVTERYVPVDPGAGGLSMTLLPESITRWVEPGGWRLQGSPTAAWLESGAVLSNLPAGTHLVEFKSVPGFAAPAPQPVQVIAEHTLARRASYMLATSTPGEPLRRVPDFDSFTTGLDDALPYAFNGQLFTDAGYASGCVVRPHTVLTAAHAVFSGESLSYVRQIWWFFQRHRGEHEPVARSPRGSFLFSGYAAARTNDVFRDGLDPGESSAVALGLDVAALYFNEDAGRGGYGGFTVWASPADWLEHPSARIALSYPVENVPDEDVGRLHQLGPERYYFTSAGGPLVSASALRVQPGSSGGPLCLKTVNTLGQFLYMPSAVQLGGTDRMIARVIDLDIADLIVRAEHASGGLLDTGGGFIKVENGGTGNGPRGGLLSLRIGPPAATRLGGAWRVSPTNHGEFGELVSYTNFANAAASLPVVSSEFGIEVRPLEGFTLPSNKLVRVVADANVLLDLGYSVVPPRFITDPVQGLGLVGTPRTAYRVEARLDPGPDAEWAPLHHITLEPGTNWLPSSSAADLTGRVYRAVWLSE